MARIYARPSTCLKVRAAMTELDTWRTANILLKRYGAEAVFIATKRADALLDQGDHEGCSAWIRIAKAMPAPINRRPRCARCENPEGTHGARLTTHRKPRSQLLRVHQIDRLDCGSGCF